MKARAHQTNLPTEVSRLKRGLSEGRLPGDRGACSATLAQIVESTVARPVGLGKESVVSPDSEIS